MDKSTMQEFERELAILIKIRRPNLVLFMGVSQTKHELCIVTEYCEGGSLFELLHQKRGIRISLKQKLKMAKDIAIGMQFLHTAEPPIIHRDLKSLKFVFFEWGF